VLLVLVMQQQLQDMLRAATIVAAVLPPPNSVHGAGNINTEPSEPSTIAEAAALQVQRLGDIIFRPPFALPGVDTAETDSGWNDQCNAILLDANMLTSASDRLLRYVAQEFQIHNQDWRRTYAFCAVERNDLNDFRAAKLICDDDEEFSYRASERRSSFLSVAPTLDPTAPPSSRAGKLAEAHRDARTHLLQTLPVFERRLIRRFGNAIPRADVLRWHLLIFAELQTGERLARFLAHRDTSDV
jgi:hypothetical protein